MAHNEPSHQDLHCLTFSLSTLPINFFSINSLLKKKKKKKKKADDKCSLNFDAERVNVKRNLNTYANIIDPD